MMASNPPIPTPRPKELDKQTETNLRVMKNRLEGMQNLWHNNQAPASVGPEVYTAPPVPQPRPTMTSPSSSAALAHTNVPTLASPHPEMFPHAPMGYLGSNKALAAQLPPPPQRTVSPTTPIQNLIAQRALEHGIDPKLALGMAWVESSFRPNAQNKNTSAGGLYQMLDSTWAKYGKGDKLDPVANTDAAMRLIRDNQKYLSKHGFVPTPEATYLAHFLGPSAAVKVMSNPRDPVDKHLSEAAVAANKLEGKTGIDLMAWAGARLNSRPTSLVSR